MVLAFLLAILVDIHTPRHFSIDEELIPYLEEVESLSKGNIKRIPYMGFGDPGKGAIAACYSGRLFNYITINKKVWKRLDHISKVLTIAHELAHCYNDIRHIDGLDRTMCPEHFMYFEDGGIYCNRDNFKRYIKQMQEI